MTTCQLLSFRSHHLLFLFISSQLSRFIYCPTKLCPQSKTCFVLAILPNCNNIDLDIINFILIYGLIPVISCYSARPVYLGSLSLLLCLHLSPRDDPSWELFWWPRSRIPCPPRDIKGCQIAQDWHILHQTWDFSLLSIRFGWATEPTCTQISF